MTPEQVVLGRALRWPCVVGAADEDNTPLVAPGIDGEAWLAARFARLLEWLCCRGTLRIRSVAQPFEERRELWGNSPQEQGSIFHILLMDGSVNMHLGGAVLRL